MGHGLGEESCLERLEELLRRRLGLRPDALRQDGLRAVRRRRARVAEGTEAGDLAHLEEAAFLAGELPHLAEALPSAETCFFRDPGQFRALSRALDSLPPGAPLRLLSAGCGSGEEAYSLAIWMRELMGPIARGVEIRAVDLDRAALRKAGAGRYPASALQTTPSETRDRWFRREGSEFVLDLRIRNRVAFEERNLASEDARLWSRGSYEVIFCRNVLTSLASETARTLVKHISLSLVPGGCLFLGPAETLRGLSEDFESRHTSGALVHHRKRLRVPEHEAPDWSTSLQNAVNEQAELEPVMQLLDSERFEDALALIDRLSTRRHHHSQIVLLRAVLLTQTGRFEEAARTCSELLARGRTRSAVRSLVARWRERRGDRPGTEDPAPRDIDNPALAMPHLHVGLLARRQEDSGTAVRELATALELLQRGERRRWSLFGGALSPAALISLCRAELASLGRGTGEAR